MIVYHSNRLHVGIQNRRANETESATFKVLAKSRSGTASRRRRYGTPSTSGRSGSALEIVLGANDFDGDTAERYGYVNRALPDAELDGFVDALARRIASFDRRAIAAAKNLINQVSLPSADRLLDALNSFQTALTWPETQQRIQNSVATRTPTRQRLRELGGPRYSARCVRRSDRVVMRLDFLRLPSASPCAHYRLAARRFKCERPQLHIISTTGASVRPYEESE